MPYKSDTEINIPVISPNKYIISSQHRKTGNPNKSIWTISFEDEVNCFIQTINSKWKAGAEAWGLKVQGPNLEQVGLSNKNEELKIAKFVDSSLMDVWHGYPANHLHKAQDRPTTEILKNWVLKGYITKAKMNKIRQGQLCTL